MTETVMYSQLQPWSTAGAPPCMEQISGPPTPIRTGVAYKTPRPHPWRPTMGYEMVEVTPLPELPTTSQLVNPCYVPPGMSTEPMNFPNLVTGFDRNPQHAARAALYSRYTAAEWAKACKKLLSEADSGKQYSSGVRSDAMRLMRQTDEKTTGGQNDSGRRIGERITAVTFWRSELSTELDKLIAECRILSDFKRNIAKALQDLEAPLHITQECLYHREGRQGIEKCHDSVEQSLLVEIENLRGAQAKLRTLEAIVNRQLSDCRAAQFTLEENLVFKESALGIDSVCHQLNNLSCGINYYGGIEKFNSATGSSELWAEQCKTQIMRSQLERSKTTQVRMDCEALINNVSSSVWDKWSMTNNTLSKHSIEMCELKSKVQQNLSDVQKEIFAVEKTIELLRKAIQDQSNPLKVAHTRLEARSHRSGLELCKDDAQNRLIMEVYDIQGSVTDLHRKLEETEAQHQQLLKTRSNLETDLKNKVTALFIDRDKCMGLRRSFPVENLIKY